MAEDYKPTPTLERFRRWVHPFPRRRSGGARLCSWVLRSGLCVRGGARFCKSVLRSLVARLTEACAQRVEEHVRDSVRARRLVSLRLVKQVCGGWWLHPTRSAPAASVRCSSTTPDPGLHGRSVFGGVMIPMFIPLLLNGLAAKKASETGTIIPQCTSCNATSCKLEADEQSVGQLVWQCQTCVIGCDPALQRRRLCCSSPPPQSRARSAALPSLACHLSGCSGGRAPPSRAHAGGRDQLARSHAHALLFLLSLASSCLFASHMHAWPISLSLSLSLSLYLSLSPSRAHLF